MLVAKDWLILHVSTQTQQMVFIQQKLPKDVIVMLLHPLQSPSLVPCDFYLLLRLKDQLNETA
jgi:hypothetical protein